MNLVDLNSVGTVLDTDNGISYPMNSDGTPDLDDGVGVYLCDVTDEWMESLSPEDATLVAAVNSRLRRDAL